MGQFSMRIIFLVGHYCMRINKQNPGLLKNRKFLNKLKKISPIAWQHIHFLGQYTFKTSEEPIDMNEILKNINWKF